MDERILNVKDWLKKKELDAFFISSVSNIIYLTNYSGFSYFEREAFLVISKNQNFLITDGRYKEEVSKIPHFQLLEISNKNSLEDILRHLSKKMKKLGIEDDDISLSESKKLEKYFKITSVSELKNLRIIKTEDEISKIKKAGEIGDETFKFILGKIRKGVCEKEIAFEIEFFIKRKRADISFHPIVAFSKNSSIPHHKTNNEKLMTNNIVLLDFGVKFENYCSDMTRTIYFGRADDKFKKIYNTVLTAQKLAIEFLVSSFNFPSSNSKKVKASSVDKVARNYIVSKGFPAIPHSLGHGIGIEVHEPPRLSPLSQDLLKPGMVFSVEPGIYLPGFGGVRIEDLVLIKKDKVEILTHSPKEIIGL